MLSLALFVGVVAVFVVAAAFFDTALASSSSSPSSSHPWSPKDFPDPTRDPHACGRPSGRASWICDPDGIISSSKSSSVAKKAAVDEIEGILRDIALARKPFAPSPCASRGGGEAKGYQVALAAMSRLDLSSSSSSSPRSAGDAAAAFAARVMDDWGVGREGCDDGVVVLLSKEDRQVRYRRKRD